MGEFVPRSSEKVCSIHNCFARAKKQLRRRLEREHNTKQSSKCEQHLMRQARDTRALEHKRRLKRQSDRDKKWAQERSHLDVYSDGCILDLQPTVRGVSRRHATLVEDFVYGAPVSIGDYSRACGVAQELQPGTCEDDAREAFVAFSG